MEKEYKDYIFHVRGVCIGIQDLLVVMEKEKTTFLSLLLGKYEYQGSIDTNAVFDYFPYQIIKEQMQLPAAEFMEELKVGCEAWRVICELSKLDEDAEILYRPFVTLSLGERTKILLAVLS